MQETPERSRIERGPKWPAIQPLRRPLGRLVPGRTRPNRLMTRPRMARSEPSWTVEVAVGPQATLAAPMGNRTTASTRMVGAAAAANESTPKAATDPISSRRDGRPRRATARAPVTEPAAMTAARAPEAPGAPAKAQRAHHGTAPPGTVA